MTPVISPAQRRRIRREARAVAVALGKARRRVKDGIAYVTRTELVKAGAPGGRIIQRVVTDHRLELLRQAMDAGVRLARAPFWAEGSVWL
jgi:hypothetical protein